MRPAYRRQRRQTPLKLKGHAIDLLLVSALAAALALSLAPLYDALQASLEAERVITTLSDRVDQTDDEKRLEVLAQAQAYNLRLGGEGAALDNVGMGGCNETTHDIIDATDRAAGADPLPYERQLGVTMPTAMCWIEIPSIALREPVYHGTSEATLSMGVGHLDWSSLPVGGTSSHCVLAAHSAMEHARMFDQLEELSEGDVFTLHVLGDAYTYQVFSCEVVLPADAPSACQIQEGQDLCTLVTCTPYAINSHRLLVHGRRIAYAANPELPETRLTSLATSRQARPFKWLVATLLLCTAIATLVRLLRLAARNVHGLIYRRTS